MKKYSFVILFFLSLITVVFTDSGKMGIQQANAANTSQYGHSIAEHSNTVIPDIELANPGTVSGTQVNHQLQKVTGHLSLPAKEKQALIASAVFVPGTPEVLSFDNNHLSHNYPSHNFW